MTPDRTLTDEELAEIEGLVMGNATTLRRLVAAVRASRSEVERLQGFLMAIYDHGMTTWSDTSCGRGGAGGQAMTTTSHPEVIQHLVSAAHAGKTLSEAADQYEAWIPGTSRLDQPPRPARRAGPDGRPL